MKRKPLSTSEMDNSDKFEALYKLHAADIRRFLFWRTKDGMLADDLTSEVFVKAWRRRATFDYQSGKAWLHTIARNTLIDHWRRKKAIPVSDPDELDEAADTPDAGEALDRTLAMEAVRQALDRLPENMRQVVELRFMEGLTSREVAERLCITEANVRVLQYRGLRKLKGYVS